MDTVNVGNVIFYMFAGVLAIVGFGFQIRKCCRALERTSTTTGPERYDQPSIPRYDAVAVANRRIPQPSAGDLSSLGNRVAVPTVYGSLPPITHESRSWTSRTQRTSNATFGFENERSTLTNINRSLDALRIQSPDDTNAPQSPPPPFSIVEPLPPMRMPKSHYEKPSSADNDGLPSYEEVQTLRIAETKI